MHHLKTLEVLSNPITGTTPTAGSGETENRLPNGQLKMLTSEDHIAHYAQSTLQHQYSSPRQGSSPSRRQESARASPQPRPRTSVLRPAHQLQRRGAKACQVRCGLVVETTALILIVKAAYNCNHSCIFKREDSPYCLHIVKMYLHCLNFTELPVAACFHMHNTTGSSYPTYQEYACLHCYHLTLQIGDRRGENVSFLLLGKTVDSLNLCELNRLQKLSTFKVCSRPAQPCFYMATASHSVQVPIAAASSSFQPNDSRTVQLPLP